MQSFLDLLIYLDKIDKKYYYDPNKISKFSAGYYPKDVKKICGECRFYADPNKCTIVDGFIDYYGSCNYYEDNNISPPAVEESDHKINQESAGYMVGSFGEYYCKNCEYYKSLDLPPSHLNNDIISTYGTDIGICYYVNGIISAEHCCNLYDEE